jgi:cytochrome b subunit of formate dehydrogenase
LRATAETALAPWLRWVVPSFADVFFLVLVVMLAFSPMHGALLRDADIGWHIRTGEIILATGAVPRTDPFSYTRQGAPWCAWEWLYDVSISVIHRLSGMNGVVFFTAAVIALTFALLFHFVLRRSGNLLLAAALTLLAVATAQVHMLARPHVVSWLFALLWIEILCRFEEGEHFALAWLPLLMVLWVNLHGGFVLGLTLLGIFAFASFLSTMAAPQKDDRRKITLLAGTLVTCLLATLLTPYGYRLPVHVYQYLSDSFLMNRIDEFASPNFHFAVYGYFELFILMGMVSVALGRERVSAAGWLTLLFSIQAGLYAVRNIPISAILMTEILGPPLALAVSPSAKTAPRWLASLLSTGRSISDNTSQLEAGLRGHGLLWIFLAGSVLLLLNGGRISSKQLIATHFDEKSFPVKAVDFVAQREIRDHLFSTDAWSGYLIYTLYPQVHVYFDDRHDFYGSAFIKEYAKAFLGTREWREPLDLYQVKWALLPADSPLSSLLRESRDWHVDYEDNLAVVFSRPSGSGER